MRQITIPWRAPDGRPAYWLQCALAWIGVLLVLTVVGHIAVRVFDLREGYNPSVGVAPDSVAGLWARWDTGYYLGLAKYGYPAQPQAVGFFPLYPLLIAGLSRLTGMPHAMAAMLISQLSYLGATFLFYKLARVVRDDHAFAMRAVLALLLFPTSFFFFASYAESISLLLSVAALYLVMGSQPHYLRSGLAISLASAARPVGWLLNVVPAVEFLRRRPFGWGAFVRLAAGGIIAISGAALFVIYLYSFTGSWTAIQDAQRNWQRRFLPPWMTLAMSLTIAATGSQVEGDWFLYTMNWADLLFSMYALVLTGASLWLAWRKRLPASLAVYLVSTVTFLLSFSGPTLVPLWGSTRWVAAVFPLHFVLVELLMRTPRAQRLVFSAFGVLQAFLFGWWVSGRWVG